MIYIATFWIIVLALFILFYIKYQYQKLEYTEGFFGEAVVSHKLKVKKAIDPAMGLIYREKPLKSGTGLLFDYGRYGMFSFWMKNTFIPLEVIALDHEYRVLGIIRDMKPKSTKSRSLDKPFRYGVEVNSGYSNEKGIVVGDKVILEYIDNL